MSEVILLIIWISEQGKVFDVMHACNVIISNKIYFAILWLIECLEEAFLQRENEDTGGKEKPKSKSVFK